MESKTEFRMLTSLFRLALVSYERGESIQGKENVILEKFNKVLSLWDNCYQAQSVFLEQSPSPSAAVWACAAVNTPTRSVNIKVIWGAVL